MQYFTDSHEWITVEGNKGRCGITEHALKQLKEIVYIELPKVGDRFEQGQDVAVLESTKAAADIFTPVTGVITKVNTLLIDQIELLNNLPESDGWIYELQIENIDELKDLYDDASYRNVLQST